MKLYKVNAQTIINIEFISCVTMYKVRGEERMYVTMHNKDTHSVEKEYRQQLLEEVYEPNS